MNKVLRQYIGKFMQVYLDDVIILLTSTPFSIDFSIERHSKSHDLIILIRIYIMHIYSN